MRRAWTSHLYLISIFLITALTACGSSGHCPPCFPEIEIVKVPHPYPVVLVIQLLPPLMLEPVPQMASSDATPKEKKTAALAIAETREKNHAKLVARDEAWTQKIEHHNGLAEDVRRNEPE